MMLANMHEHKEPKYLSFYIQTLQERKKLPMYALAFAFKFRSACKYIL